MATVENIPVATLESKVIIRSTSQTTTEYEGPPVPVASHAMTIDPDKAVGTIGEHAHGHPDLSLWTLISKRGRDNPREPRFPASSPKHATAEDHYLPTMTTQCRDCRTDECARATDLIHTNGQSRDEHTRDSHPRTDERAHAVEHGPRDEHADTRHPRTENARTATHDRIDDRRADETLCGFEKPLSIGHERLCGAPTG